MRKIFIYDCKRLFCNKFFCGLALLTLFYSWEILNHITLYGISNTAPFSPLSYGNYLRRMLPLLWTGVLFFLIFFTSKAEQRRVILCSATAMKPATYRLIRSCVVLTGFLLLSLMVILLAVIFYGWMFEWYSWISLISTTLLTLGPSFVLIPFLIFVLLFYLYRPVKIS